MGIQQSLLGIVGSAAKGVTAIKGLSAIEKQASETEKAASIAKTQDEAIEAAFKHDIVNEVQSQEEQAEQAGHKAMKSAKYPEQLTQSQADDLSAIGNKAMNRVFGKFKYRDIQKAYLRGDITNRAEYLNEIQRYDFDLLKHNPAYIMSGEEIIDQQIADDESKKESK